MQFTLALMALAPARAHAECAPPKPGETALLHVIASDPGLTKSAPLVERAVRNAAGGLIELLPADATRRALTVEGGAEERERAVIDARVVIGRAEDKFRELDDEEALSLVAKATARLNSVSREPGALELLARAHLLAGAIYLARGRTEAARQRLQRALDLDPALAPPRDRFAPEVLAELAAVKAASALRPVGRLSIQTPDVNAEVFLDGRLAGSTPLELDAVPSGNHVLRISAPGRLSHVESIQISPAEELSMETKLARDPEIEAVESIEARSNKGEDVTAALSLLARRAGTKRVVLASMVLGAELSRAGTATIGIELSVLDAGSTFAANLERETLRDALSLALACAPAEKKAPVLAPSILGLGDPRASRPEPVPEDEPFWNRPWFWGVAAMATICLSGAFVVARTSGGPPEAVELHLIPRP